MAANGPSRSIGVLDCATDSFLKWIPDAGVACVTWDSIGNKIYVNIGLWGQNKVVVVDCATDSVVKVISDCPPVTMPQ